MHSRVGTVDLKSTPGQGTTFTIKIPLTLAIVSALIVAAGSERFAIPQISVLELVRAQKEATRGHNEAGGTEPMIERINDTPVLRLLELLLPLVNLNELLALGDTAGDESGASRAVSLPMPPTPTTSAVASGRWTTPVSSGAGFHSHRSWSGR